jgi:alkylation response protein AidB-like acyl-CoA dehydrogenase
MTPRERALSRLIQFSPRIADQGAVVEMLAKAFTVVEASKDLAEAIDETHVEQTTKLRDSERSLRAAIETLDAYDPEAKR